MERGVSNREGERAYRACDLSSDLNLVRRLTEKRC
jgi:hypothetical protein